MFDDRHFLPDLYIVIETSFAHWWLGICLEAACCLVIQFFFFGQASNFYSKLVLFLRYSIQFSRISTCTLIREKNLTFLSEALIFSRVQVEKVKWNAAFDQMVVICPHFLIENLAQILPSKGICSDVMGMASLILCWNTVNDKRTVTPEMQAFAYWLNWTRVAVATDGKTFLSWWTP